MLEPFAGLPMVIIPHRLHGPVFNSITTGNSFPLTSILVVLRNKTSSAVIDVAEACQLKFIDHSVGNIDKCTDIKLNI